MWGTVGWYTTYPKIWLLGNGIHGLTPRSTHYRSFPGKSSQAITWLDLSATTKVQHCLKELSVECRDQWWNQGKVLGFKSPICLHDQYYYVCSSEVQLAINAQFSCQILKIWEQCHQTPIFNILIIKIVHNVHTQYFQLPFPRSHPKTHSETVVFPLAQTENILEVLWTATLVQPKMLAWCPTHKQHLLLL